LKTGRGRKFDPVEAVCYQDLKHTILRKVSFMVIGQGFEENISR